MAFTYQRYEILRDTFHGQRLPPAVVDFDANVDHAAAVAQKADKKPRIGTKPMRCLRLMERVPARAASVFRGTLTFTAKRPGHDDLLPAHPTGTGRSRPRIMPTGKCQ